MQFYVGSVGVSLSVFLLTTLAFFLALAQVPMLSAMCQTLFQD